MAVLPRSDLLGLRPLDVRIVRTCVRNSFESVRTYLECVRNCNKSLGLVRLSDRWQVRPPMHCIYLK